MPSETAIVPSRTIPVPTSEHGLSPDHATTFAAGNPCRARQYVASGPTTVHDGAIGGSFDSRSGAVAARASGAQRERDRSIRFIPEPSPGSIGASKPTSSDAAYEDTRWIRVVDRYAAGSSLKNLRICGPVNRSNAREPVSIASRSGPPTAAVISAHSAAVLESIQIGDSGRTKTPRIWDSSGRAASRDASACAAAAPK